MNNTTAVIADNATGSYVSYEPGFLCREERAAIRADIERHRSAFETGTMLVAGREVATPRMVVAFGDGKYRYPDMGESLPWPASLLAARERLQAAAGHRFNYALVNLYRDGHDYTGWHADKMHMHVPETAIAIISLGAVRPLCFRTKETGDDLLEIPLADGSLLWMRGNTQSYYEHSIPVDDCLTLDRVSVTFRYVLEPQPEAS